MSTPSSPDPSSHSVEQHLRVAYDDYDRAIRTLVPHYDEMLTNALELLAVLVPRDAHILDLGGGTGALSEAVLRALPGVRVTLLDLDAQMLAQARGRLAPLSARVTFVEGNFHDALPRADAVVASLALHHIRDLDRKVRVYTAIHDGLPPGGLFLNLDATVSADATLAAQTFTRWARSMGEHGIDEATARRHFDDWAREDRYFSLREEIDALVRAGFAEPECFWRRGSGTIYGALR